jgi:hypothetical protein
VIDASVALKWMTPEEDSERAILVLDLGRELHAPAFIFMELANALRIQVRAGKADAAGASAALDDVRTAPSGSGRARNPCPIRLRSRPPSITLSTTAPIWRSRSKSTPPT